MHSLFQWQANVNNNSRDPGLHPQALPPPDTEYIHLMEILRDIQDGINPADDGCPTKEVFEDARTHYELLLKSGNIDQLLLGDASITTTSMAMNATSSQSHKWTAEGLGDHGRRSSKHRAQCSGRGAGPSSQLLS